MVESFFDGSAELLLSPHVTISDSIWTFLGILVNISLRIHLFAQLSNIKLGGGDLMIFTGRYTFGPINRR